MADTGCEPARCAYTRDDIVRMVSTSLDGDMDTFYRRATKRDPLTGNPGWLNFASDTHDQRGLCMDVAAEQLCLHPEKLRQIGTGKLPRQKSFNAGHDGRANTRAREERFGSLKYSEKLLARGLYNRYCNRAFDRTNLPFDAIVDYETPLQEQKDGTLGAVDLLGLQEAALKLIELKIRSGRPHSGDGLLRAVLEAYTYYRAMVRSPLDTVPRLLSDFPILDGLPAHAYHFVPVVMVERLSCAAWQLGCIGLYPNVQRLVRWIHEEHDVWVEFYVFDYPSRSIARDGDDRIQLIGPLTAEKCRVGEET